MTLQECVDRFAYLQDKFGSANFENDETIALLNMGINEYLNRLCPDNQGGVVNWEFDSNVAANIQPLIYTLTGLSMTAAGLITNSTINTALVTASHSGAEVFRIGSVGVTTLGTTRPSKYLKQNNRWSAERNVFKQPSNTNPRYTLIASGLQFFPISTTSTVTVNVIKKPKILAEADLASAVELPDYTMYNVIVIAVKLGGVATRDEELINDLRMTGIQVAQ